MDGKHPGRRNIDADHLEEYEELPEFQEVVITGETVERVAKNSLVVLVWSILTPLR